MLCERGEEDYGKSHAYKKITCPPRGKNKENNYMEYVYDEVIDWHTDAMILKHKKLLASIREAASIAG